MRLLHMSFWLSVFKKPKGSGTSHHPLHKCTNGQFTQMRTPTPKKLKVRAVLPKWGLTPPLTTRRVSGIPVQPWGTRSNRDNFRQLGDCRERHTDALALGVPQQHFAIRGGGQDAARGLAHLNRGGGNVFPCPAGVGPPKLHCDTHHTNPGTHDRTQHTLSHWVTLPHAAVPQPAHCASPVAANFPLPHPCRVKTQPPASGKGARQLRRQWVAPRL